MKTKKFSIFVSFILLAVMISSSILSAGAVSYAEDLPPGADTPYIEEVNPYFSVEHLTLEDGTGISAYIINGPPQPPSGYDAEYTATIIPETAGGNLPDFPAFTWVFGCSAVSGAMIAGYYDRNGFPNMYAGPTDGGVMPLTDTSWPTWTDGAGDDYPNNPLIASHNGVDGRATRGSIDNYWVKFESTAQDPYLTNGWTQHTWGSAIGDFMKTSQSKYKNIDGSSTFYNYISLPDKLTCAFMETADAEPGVKISERDGNYGRKLFYEARGYTVGDCYNQKTDNNAGGFTFANYKAEIDAGHPVMIHVEGHTMVGYGYSGSNIVLRDTWDTSSHSMPWGGSYEGMKLLSVSILNLKQTQPPPVGKKTFLPLIVLTVLTTPTQPLKNGDFEKGPDGSWTESSNHGWPIILYKDDLVLSPHGGQWAAWLAGDYNEISKLSQKVTVPASQHYLKFWYAIGSEDSCGKDYAYVKIDGTSVTKFDLCKTTNTGGWKSIVVNLSAYAGKTVTLMFEATTNASLNSNFFLDDVAFSSSSTAALPDFVQAEDVMGILQEKGDSMKSE